MLHSFSPLMRRTKVLVIALAHLYLVLPSVIFADDQYAYPLLYQQVDNLAARRVHILVNAAVALGGHTFHACGGAGMPKLVL